MTIIKIFDKYPEIFKKISSYIVKNINEIYNKENVYNLLNISFDKNDGFIYNEIVYRPCINIHIKIQGYPTELDCFSWDEYDVINSYTYTNYYSLDNIKQQCLDIISTIDKVIKKCKIIEEVDLMLTLNGFGI
jgi:hypothetical protein